MYTICGLTVSVVLFFTQQSRGILRPRARRWQTLFDTAATNNKKRPSLQTWSLFSYPRELYKISLILYNSTSPDKATLLGGIVVELAAGTSALQNHHFVQFATSFQANSPSPFGHSLRVSFYHTFFCLSIHLLFVKFFFFRKTFAIA